MPFLRIPHREWNPYHLLMPPLKPPQRILSAAPDLGKFRLGDMDRRRGWKYLEGGGGFLRSPLRRPPSHDFVIFYFCTLRWVFSGLFDSFTHFFTWTAVKPLGLAYIMQHGRTW